MTRYVFRRALQAVPMLLLVGSLGFTLIHLAPGDPVIALAGEYAHEAVQRELREGYGLDRSPAEQYVLYMSRLVQGDLGVSYYFQRPVTSVILDRLPATLLLVLPALFTSTLAGTGLGLALARRTRPGRARGLVAAIAASNAVPVFWLAQILLLVFAVFLGWFPVQGMTDPHGTGPGLDLARHLVLPLATLVLHQLAFIAVLTWTGVERELSRDYARAAEGRGLSRGAVLAHAFRNVLPSLLTVVGNRAGMLITGAVLVETVFAWPGLGRLSVLASMNRDYPLVLGLFLLVAAAVIVANLATDVLYVLVDPRIRYR